MRGILIAVVLAGAAQAQDFSRAAPVDEAYRAEFAACDSGNVFRGERMRGDARCSSNPSNVTLLARQGPAVVYESALGVDLRGSNYVCEGAGPRGLCATWLTLADGAPVSSDLVPYVTIPGAGAETPELNGEFRALTGVQAGDFGVVIYQGRATPAIVASRGAHNRLGAGSMALHRALGRETCYSRNGRGECQRPNANVNSGIASGVTTVLFPGTARDGLTAEDVLEVICAEGARLWGEFRASVSADDLEIVCGE